MHMQQNTINSIWDSIDSQKDAVKAAKSPCFPVPYTLLTVERPLAGNKRGIIPCVELQNIHGSYEIRRCEDILKPKAGEPINFYLNRLECELTYKEVNGEMIL